VRHGDFACNLRMIAARAVAVFTPVNGSMANPRMSVLIHAST